MMAIEELGISWVRFTVKPRVISTDGNETYYGVSLPYKVFIKTISVPVVVVTPYGKFKFYRKLFKTRWNNVIVVFPKKFNYIWSKLAKEKRYVDVYLPITVVEVKKIEAG